MQYPMESLYLHMLNALPQFGPKRLMLLENYFKSFQSAYHANKSELLAAGIDEKIVDAFFRHRTQTHIEQEQEKLETSNIRLLTFNDASYPQLLHEIPAFPPLLYLRGQIFLPEELCIAIVGTRKISTYGRTVTSELVKPLAENGLTIISGLAYGVDALAHECAVQSKKRTVAVVASGVEEGSLYPKDHAYLAKKIIDTGGCLLSEHPPGTPALKQHFVARNRIISGLSVGTLVVECNLKSGALITARHALDQNRQVFAVPGPIYSKSSEGPNNLLKMGAACVTHANDILESLNIKPAEEQLPVAEFDVTPIEKIILQNLSFDPQAIDEIIKKVNANSAEVSAGLTFLEMKGKIRNLGGQQYILARKL